MEASNDIDDTSGGGSDVVDGYEQLRAARFAATPRGGGWGWGCCSSAGSPHGCEVRQARVPNISPPMPAPAASPLAGGVEAELVGLLASMALAVATRG